MIYRIFPEKDTFISSYRVNDVAKTGSNFGSCEILHVYKKTEYSLTSSLARILTKFDLGPLASMTASGEFPSTGLSYHLKLFDAEHNKTLPYGFDVEVQAVSQDWDEGRGHDVDHFSDKGVANWDKAKSNVWWTVTGSVGTGSIATAHFDLGNENLYVDVTNIVNTWLSGNLPNYGFLVKISSSQESDENDYYVKMFHSRETFFKSKRPALEVTWDDSKNDDRNNFYLGITGSLYMHNIVKGTYTNLSNTGSLMVRIADLSGTLLTMTASFTGDTGRYSASFALAEAQYSGTTFTDTWYSGSYSYMTGSFKIMSSSLDTISQKRYAVSMPNLKNTYDSSEVVRMNIYTRPHDYNLARTLTASYSPTGIVIDNAYYRILNDRTSQEVIPFGTGSVKFTKTSYDKNGNYFKLYMSSLAPNEVYRVQLLYVVNGYEQLIDGDFKFRVV